MGDGKGELQFLIREIASVRKQLKLLVHLQHLTEGNLNDLETTVEELYKQKKLLTCFPVLNGVVYQAKMQIVCACEELKKEYLIAHTAYPKASSSFHCAYVTGSSPSCFWVKTTGDLYVKYLLSELKKKNALKKIDHPHIGTQAVVVQGNNIFRSTLAQKVDGNDGAPDKYLVQDLDSTLSILVKSDELYEVGEELSRVNSTHYNCSLEGAEDCVLPRELEIIFTSLLLTCRLNIVVTRIKSYLLTTCIVQLKATNNDSKELDVNGWIAEKILPLIINKESLNSLPIDVLDPFSSRDHVRVVPEEFPLNLTSNCENSLIDL